MINYRLAAFAGLGVVAGLMVQNSMDALSAILNLECL